MARRRLKSPSSLFHISAFTTMFTQRPPAWSWVMDSHPCRSMPIGLSISGIRLSNLDLENWGSGSWVWSTDKVGPASCRFASFSFHINQQQQFLRYNYFQIWPWKIQVHSHGWGQRWRLHHWRSIQPINFLFLLCQSNLPLRNPRFNAFSIAGILLNSWIAFNIDLGS